MEVLTRHFALLWGCCAVLCAGVEDAAFFIAALRLRGREDSGQAHSGQIEVKRIKIKGGMIQQVRGQMRDGVRGTSPSPP